MKIFVILLLAKVMIGEALEPVFDLPHRGCYYTNWSQYRQGVAKYKPENVDPALCTYIAIAFGKIENGQLAALEWNDEETFEKLVTLKQRNPNLKILLSVGGWTLTTQLVTMSSTASSRKIFIDSAISNLRKWRLDGLDIDWEFPLAADRATYSTLLTEIRAAFEKESTVTGKTRLALTAAVHLISDGGFDGAVINKTLDVASVMTYDLDGAWDVSQTGHQAPLFSGPFGSDSSLNVASIMEAWVDAGVAKSKLAVGLPLYGRGWMLSNSRASSSGRGLREPATAPITASVYTTEMGSWPFFEICQKIKTSNAINVFNPTIQATYAYTDTWWMGYDDIETISRKTKWAQANGFGGVFVWDLAQDDFGNLCGYGKNPLLNAIKNGQIGVIPVAPSVSISAVPKPSTSINNPTLGISTVTEPVFDLPHRGCYYTNWSQYRQGVASYKAGNVDPTLCTYIAIAFAKIENNQLAALEWNDEETFAKLVTLKQRNPNLKILLSVGGWTLTTQLVTMSSTASSRKIFIDSAISNLRKWRLDGLDIDWEFPLAADRATYSTLLTEIRAAFEKESIATGNTRLALTAAVHLISDGGFDGAVINKTLDVASVMTYDLDGAWDVSQTGHQAPLFSGPFGSDSSLNVASIMEAWVDAGVAKSKLAVGLPLYGRGWMLSNSRASSSGRGLREPATAPITASVYTTEMGSWPFFEICQKIKTSNAINVFNPTIQATYAYTDTWWMGYDDIETITRKTKWAQANGFGGVFVWDLAQDDFGNLCGYGKNPLLNAIKNGQIGVIPVVPPAPVVVAPLPTSSTAPEIIPNTTTGFSTSTEIPVTSAIVVETFTDNTLTAQKPCDQSLCRQDGPGVVGLGGCSSDFCLCDVANNAFKASCVPSLAFDEAIKSCNFRSSILACALIDKRF